MEFGIGGRISMVHCGCLCIDEGIFGNVALTRLSRALMRSLGDIVLVVLA